MLPNLTHPTKPEKNGVKIASERISLLHKLIQSEDENDPKIDPDKISLLPILIQFNVPRKIMRW